ncbi:MAG TPA: hypothetical protein ENI92_02325 [Bacteroidetes bacterium]|nr:hypothetical protein [Bacteroidota bacterium]
MPEQTDKSLPPFKVMDCTLITRMGGVDNAMNLRELRERVATCPVDCIFHHFYETLIRPSFDDPEFRNDFAVWASRELRDRVLAERLGVLNPYEFENMEQLRAAILELLDERLAELPNIPWAPKGHEFYFMRAVTVIFPTGIEIHTLEELARRLPRLSHGSLYYHVIEAHRRPPLRRDDFTAWMLQLPEPPHELIRDLERIDFYFLTLAELRESLISTVQRHLFGEEAHA